MCLRLLIKSEMIHHVTPINPENSYDESVQREFGGQRSIGVDMTFQQIFCEYDLNRDYRSISSHIRNQFNNDLISSR